MNPKDDKDFKPYDSGCDWTVRKCPHDERVVIVTSPLIRRNVIRTECPICAIDNGYIFYNSEALDELINPPKSMFP